MSKRVNRGARIVLGGMDITHDVMRWKLGAEINELYIAEIDVLDHPRVIELVQDERKVHGYRVAVKDKVLIKGVDISNHIASYDRLTKIGRPDVIRLYVQCDEDVLSINGTTPWVDQSPPTTHPLQGVVKWSKE